MLKMCIGNKKGTVIPNSYPYKEELLNEAEKALEQEKQMKAMLKSQESANKTLPGGDSHVAQIIRADVQKQ